MKKIYCILFLIFLLLLIPPQAFPFARGKTVVFGGGSGFAPYEYLDPSGGPKGFDVELVREMARIKGWDIEIRLMDWPLAIDALRKGEVDALLGMLYSEERDREFDFSDPHSTLELSLFTRKDALPLFTLDDLKGRKIAVYDRGMPLEILRERKKIKTSVMKDMKDVFSALARGEVDAALCPKLMGLSWMLQTMLTQALMRF